MAWLLLEDLETEQIVSTIRKEYRVSSSRAKADLNILQDQLHELMRTNGACPIHQLELDVQEIIKTKLSLHILTEEKQCG